MIVHENHRVGGRHDGEAEHFAGMNQNRVLSADGYDLMPLDAAARVQ